MRKLIIALIIVVMANQISAQNYKFGKVSKEELEEKFYSQDSSANAVVLYKNRRTYFNTLMNFCNHTKPFILNIIKICSSLFI